MCVVDEERAVGLGGLIYVPSGDEVLTYVLAATSGVEWQAFYDTGASREGSTDKEERTSA